MQNLRTHQLCLDHDHNSESQLKSMTSLVDLILLCKQGAPFPNNYISLHQLQGPGSRRSGLVCTSSHAREILWNPPFSLLTITLVWSKTPLNSGENKPSGPDHGLSMGVSCTAWNCTLLITAVDKLLMKTAWEIRACTSQEKMIPDNDPSDAAVNFSWHLSTQITLRRETVSQPCLSIFLAVLLRLLKRP